MDVFVAEPEQNDYTHTRLTVTPKDALALRINDACSLIGVARSTLYRLIDSGEVKTIRIGGRHLVPRSELDRLVAGA
jgi:excisionase family DNA binding protein